MSNKVQTINETVYIAGVGQYWEIKQHLRSFASE